MLSGCMDTHTYCARTHVIAAELDGHSLFSFQVVWPGRAAYMQLTVNNF